MQRPDPALRRRVHGLLRGAQLPGGRRVLGRRDLRAREQLRRLRWQRWP
ncbi:MAG: 50S ribosomal protein L34 [Deltaproteobacteria bacterium]|nr:50S ribosomal protein L34 [Deltaproteobacteria bacterium]